MVIAYDEQSIVRYMQEAVEYSHDRPVLIDHFLEDAIEVDVDALSDGEDVVIGGIMQHIEEAGIHSGDSSCVLPAVDIPQHLLERMREYTFKLAKALKVIGLMNIQFAIPRGNGNAGNGSEGGKVYVLEVNPRASRTVPYVSKATGIPMAKIAARLMTGRKLREFLPEFIERRADLDTGNYYYVKSPVFPWSKFPGVDTVLGPEMKSTGEVMGVADNFGEAFAKAQLAAGQKLPTQGAVFISVTDHDKLHVARGRPQVRRHGIQAGRHRRHGRRNRSRRHERGARLQSERRTSQRRRLHQGPAHSARHQHAHRTGAVVRRESDSPRGSDGAHSNDHDAGRSSRGSRGHCRLAARGSECEGAAAVACGANR